MHILTFSLLSLVLTVAVMELERLKNQHLILPYYCLLHSLLDFRLIVHLLFCALRKCTTGFSDMVQAKFLPEDMRKTLIIDEGTTKCNNPQLNKLLFYYFSALFFVSLRKQQKLFIFTFFYLISTKVLAALKYFNVHWGRMAWNGLELKIEQISKLS